MYKTVEDIYKALLREVKKDNIATISPPLFNIIINDAYTLWYREKTPEVEFNEKRINDLKEFKVVTDHKFNLKPILALELNYDSNESSNIFPLPKSSENDFQVVLSYTYTGHNGEDQPFEETYPNYRRCLGVWFKVKYTNEDCYEGKSPWIKADVLKSLNKDNLHKNPFRRPKPTKLYYEIVGDKVVLEKGDVECYGVEMKLEYLKYPRPIFYNHDNPGESIMPEVQPDQIHEIVKLAARVYTGNVGDPRYQVKVNEYMANMKGK